MTAPPAYVAESTLLDERPSAAKPYGHVEAFREDVESLMAVYEERSLPDAPLRTRKHIATPERGSHCKRLNMYLRWMVRQDNKGVDFGVWKSIAPSQLICPCDLHVDRVGRRLKLIKRKQTDWLTALELTANLQKLDADDPVKYDFALFGMGVGKVTV